MIAPDRSSMTVDIVVTLDDQVRYAALILSTPEMRRAYRRRWASTILLAPPIGLVLGTLVGLLSDAKRLSWSDLVDAFSADLEPLGVAWLLITLGLLGSMAAERPLRGRRLRAQTQMMLRERPGIDPDDPQLRERVRCCSGPEGYRCEGSGGTTLVTWDGVKGLDETPELLVVRTGRFSGFVLPRREMDVEEIAAFRQIVGARLRQRSAGP